MRPLYPDTWSRAEFLSRKPAARRRRISHSAKALYFASCSLRGSRHVPCTTWIPALPAELLTIRRAVRSTALVDTTPRPSHPQPSTTREQKSLLEPGTYKRPDAEVLPLITPATARAKDAVRRMLHRVARERAPRWRGRPCLVAR